MDIHPLLIQFGGSLVAILAIYFIVRAMKLGGKAVLRDEAAVRMAAGEVHDGFTPHRIAISREGAAALARDAEGQIMLIKRHGNQFAGRILTGDASAKEAVDTLIVDSGEARFGSVKLTLGDASAWADAINRL